jgi:hypothetical protein
MIRAKENLDNDNMNTLNIFEMFFDLSPDLLCRTGFDEDFKKKQTLQYLYYYCIKIKERCQDPLMNLFLKKIR